MDIVNGLFDHMVLQRGAKNLSEAAVAGASKANGTLVATVTKAGKSLKGLSKLKIGTVKGGKFAVCLKGIPVGGPYTVELSVTDAKGATLDKLTVKDVLVGDVWILGGQSNMQGVGDKFNGLRSSDDVRAFFMDDHWDVAKDPIHDLSIAVDQVHVDLCGGVRHAKPTRYCAGPGLPFAIRMKELLGVPQGVIACGHGGTSMSQWNPNLKSTRGKSLYGAMLRRFVKNGGKAAGMIWYQGCSDANAEAAPLFTRRMKEFVAACRKDFRAPNLPFAQVQISRVVGWPSSAGKHWNSIQEQQRLLPSIVKNCLTVPAIDLPLEDLIHVSGFGMVELGRRLAQAMDTLLRGKAGGRPPIELKKASVTPAPERETVNLVVEFENVVGELRSNGRPHGFSLMDGLSDSESVFDVKLDGNRAIVRTSLGVGQLNGLSLHYGLGANPFCNITDEAGRSLPVFGPMVFGKPQALTPFATRLRVSDHQPSAAKLDDLAFPKDLGLLNLKPRSFSGNFCDMHTEIAARADGDSVLYFACGIECQEPMKLSALLGYDGPVKLWLDGRRLFHDPNGTNPALPDAHAIKFDAGAGRHEILIALGTNSGAAWGVFLRFVRRDVSQAKLKAGPDSYKMPAILG